MPEGLLSDWKKFANGFLWQKDRENREKNNVVFFRGALVLSPSRRREGILFAIWSGFSSKVENGETNKNLGMSSKTSKSARCVRKSQLRLQVADLKGNSQ